MDDPTTVEADRLIHLRLVLAAAADQPRDEDAKGEPLITRIWQGNSAESVIEVGPDSAVRTLKDRIREMANPKEGQTVSFDMSTHAGDFRVVWMNVALKEGPCNIVVAQSTDDLYGELHELLWGIVLTACVVIIAVIVVLGASAQDVRAATTRAATFVENTHWQSGQTGSMQCGLRAVPADSEGVLFTLVDHPAVRLETIDALLRADVRGDSETGKLKHAPPRLRVPVYQGRNGHPIWFSRGLIREFLAIEESGAARDVVRTHSGETEFVDVDDAGVVADIDDPAAYRALIEAES